MFAATKTDRRFAVTKGKPHANYVIKDMHELAHQIKRRIFLGQKNIEIARALNVTKEQVSNIRNSPVVQAELKNLHTKADAEVINIRNEVNQLAPKAVKVLEEILDSPDIAPNVKLAAARDTLDRSGNAAPQQIQHMHGHFTMEDLEKIKNRAMQIGTTNGPVVDPINAIELEK